MAKTPRDHARSGRDLPSARGEGARPRPAPKPHRSERPPGRGESRPSGPAGKRAEPPRPPLDKNLALIWGNHAVVDALRSERRKVVRLLATEGAAERIAPLAAERDLTVSVVSAETIAARVPRDAVHQGLLLEARPLEPIDIADIPEGRTVLVLDQITDPHNVGAIIRTAAAYGVAAMVLTDRHTPELSGTLAKAASGGLEHVPIALVVNLARALDQLEKRGFRCIGLDSDGTVSLEEVDVGGSIALVLGAEDKGLRRLTRERCDVIARLDMPGPIKSLNVSNACVAALTIVKLRTSPGSQ